jgi:hypothetical protein
MRRVEAEVAGRRLLERAAVLGACVALAEQPIGLLRRGVGQIDEQEAVGQAEGGLDRVGHAARVRPLGSIVIGLASLIIGEVLFGKRSFLSRLLSMLFGAITYRIIIALVLRMGMAADDLKLFTALTVALALSLPRFKDLRDTLKVSLNGRKSHA